MVLPCSPGRLASSALCLRTSFGVDLLVCPPVCPVALQVPQRQESGVSSLFFVVVFFILFFQLKIFYTISKCCFPFAVKTSVLSYLPDSLVSAPSI